MLHRSSAPCPIYSARFEHDERSIVISLHDPVALLRGEPSHIDLETRKILERFNQRACAHSGRLKIRYMPTERQYVATILRRLSDQADQGEQSFALTLLADCIEGTGSFDPAGLTDVTQEPL